MPSPGIQLERTFGRQTRHGGSTQSLNKMTLVDPMAVPLSVRHATSNSDLAAKATTTIATITMKKSTPKAAVVAQPKATAAAGISDGGGADQKTAGSEAAAASSPTASRSKFAPGNIFKNFFK